MRLIFLLTALITVLKAQNRLGKVTNFPLPGGFPDGSILTFYFWHEGDSSEFESVDINFYEVPLVDRDELYDISAHLRIDRTLEKPVKSNTFVKGNWLEQTSKDQPLDELPPYDGWWRVDVYKHDSEHLNVFFQGFWSDVRTFKKSLDNVQIVYVMKHVDQSRVQIRMKVPNGILPPLSFAQFDKYFKTTTERKIIALPAFPIATHIEVTAWLAASGGGNTLQPTLSFKRKDGVEFMKIYQKWESGTEALYIYSNDKGILCINQKPSGDLQHLHLSRSTKNIIKLQVFYKSNNSNGIICEHYVPDDLSSGLDGPFDIMATDGALLFHLDHTIPRTVGVRDK